jgi:hypothetical protein
MLKWLGGIVGAVLVGVLTWWLTVGIHGDRDNPVVPTYSVTGYWNYTTKSNVSGNTNTGAITLTQDGNTVSGVLEAFDKSMSGVTGTLYGNTLELSRDTGLDTIQTYRLSRQGDSRLVGTFANVGKVADNGSIQFDR